jgi:hypothetical protein
MRGGMRHASCRLSHVKPSLWSGLTSNGMVRVQQSRVIQYAFCKCSMAWRLLCSSTVDSISRIPSPRLQAHTHMYLWVGARSHGIVTAVTAGHGMVTAGRPVLGHGRSRRRGAEAVTTLGQLPGPLPLATPESLSLGSSLARPKSRSICAARVAKPA